MSIGCLNVPFFPLWGEKILTSCLYRCQKTELCLNVLIGVEYIYQILMAGCGLSSLYTQ